MTPIDLRDDGSAPCFMFVLYTSPNRIYLYNYGPPHFTRAKMPPPKQNAVLATKSKWRYAEVIPEDRRIGSEEELEDRRSMSRRKTEVQRSRLPAFKGGSFRRAAQPCARIDY